MCCFSGPVESVSATRIFARAGAKDRQFIVYSMQVGAKEDLAMILPIPTPEKTADDAVKFINLEKYPKFFADMKLGFPVPAANRDAAGNLTKGEAAPKPKLVVVDVGDFEASFVPTVADFSRLDKRFRLPEGTWDKLPQYKKWGFAVFKLKKLKKEKTEIHPMAFDFPRADADTLFFPTVHIHDGKVHDKAEFDHVLYCQEREGQMLSIYDWTESPEPAKGFMKIDQTKSIVDGAAHVYRRIIKGVQKNEDTILA